MGYYRVAQICLNGHQITGNYSPSSPHAADYCPKCGAETITECSTCKADIRGNWDSQGAGFSIAGFTTPAFCHECGKPFEWTLRQVQAAKDLADEIEDVSADELAKAKSSFIDLASDTPQTPVAAARINKLMKKAGPVIGGGIRDIVVSIATDAAKKMMGL